MGVAAVVDGRDADSMLLAAESEAATALTAAAAIAVGPAAEFKCRAVVDVWGWGCGVAHSCCRADTESGGAGRVTRWLCQVSETSGPMKCIRSLQPGNSSSSSEKVESCDSSA